MTHLFIAQLPDSHFTRDTTDNLTHFGKVMSCKPSTDYRTDYFIDAHVAQYVLPQSKAYGTDHLLMIP